MPIKQDVQSLSPGGIVEMFELDATNLGTPISGMFCAVATSGTGNRIMTSPDGSNWVSRTGVGNYDWQSITWSPELNLFCAVSSNIPNVVMTSPDGITWTSRNSTENIAWQSVAWSPELNLFCAVASTGTSSRVMTSPDGITWTSRNSPNNDWRSITWSPKLNLFCVVASSGINNRVMTSPDGINWSLQTSAVDNNWFSVAWSPKLSLFCAVAYVGTSDRVMTSPDGVNWTSRTSAGDSGWYSIVWSPELSLFCAVAYYGTNRVMTSVDGINWVPRVSASNNLWSSITWSSELNLFCAVAFSGTGDRVMTSPEGVNWTLQNSAADNNWSSIIWRPLKGGGPPVYRFHSGKNEFKTDLIWQGDTYSAFPIEAEGFEVSTQGVLPKPTLRVANIDGSIGSLNRTYKDLVGAKVTRKRTLTKYLDTANFTAGNPLADPNEAFPDDVFYVNRKISENRVFVEYELASVMDVEGVKLPRRQIIQNICTWVYRSSECGYAGSNYFDVNDNSVSTLAEDVCSKKVSGCKVRFPKPSSLPYGGFPGAGLF